MKRRSKDQQGKEMQAERGFLESLLDATQALIVVLDTEGRVVLFNRACQETTGYSAEEVMGRNWFDLFLPEQVREKANEAFQKLLEGQLSSQYENPILTRDGQKRLIEWDNTFLRNEEGMMNYVIGTGRDITERKQAEAALKRRLEQLTGLSQASQAVTASLELDQVLAEIIALASEVVASDYASVVLLDEEGRLGRSAEDLPGVPTIDCRIRAEGFTHWIVRSHQAVVVDDVDEDGTVNPRLANGAPCTANPLIVEAGVKSFVGLPLLAQDRLLGVFYLHSLHPGSFRDQLPLLTTFANQVVIAIENARLYQAERKRATQLAVVNQVARQAASILDLDRLLQEIVTTIQQGFNYHNVVLFLLDEAASELELRAVAGGFADVAAPGYRQAMGVGMIGWTAETGQPILASDVRQEPRYIPGFLEETLTNSELCVPLKLAGQVIGVLDVQDTQLNAFDETDLLAMETLADQFAMAIENVQLFGETKHRLEEITALYQTSLDITAQLEMTKLLKSIMERAVGMLDAETGTIYLYDQERGELRQSVAYGYSEKYVGVILKPGEGLAGKVFQSGEPMIIDDYRTWEGRAAVFEADQPFSASLQVPLKWQERIIGVLSIDADVQKRTFNQDDVWLATLFANQAAIAIENARIYAEERKRATQLELIGGITQKIASILDLDELLPQVAHLIGETFDYYYTSILLVEAGSDELIMRAGAGPFFDTLVGRLRLKIGREGITGWVAHSGEPLLVNDVSREPRYYPTEKAKDTRSELAVPIKLKEEVIGILDVQSLKLDAFGEDDVSILQTLADQLAIAIENAQLYEAEAQRRQEAETLRQAGMALTSTLDLEETLDRILEQLHRVVAYDSASVQLLQDDHLEIVGGRGFADSSAVIGLRFPVPGDNPNTRVIESGEPVILADARTAHAPFREPPHDHIRSWLGVPVRFREQTVGMITLDSTELGHFTADHARLAAAFANQAAVAIENARLYQQVVDLAADLEVRVQERAAELIHRARDLSFLYQASVDLSSTLEREEVLDILARRAILAMDAVDCTLYELHDDALVVVARHRDPALPRKDLEIGRRYLLADYPATREAIEKGQPLRVRVDDPLADEAERAELQRLGYTALLQVHIVSRGQVLGVVEVFDDKPEREFGEDDAALLQTITNQAGMAIEKAHLFQQIREESNRLALLYDVSRKLSATMDPEQALRDIFQVSVAATGASGGSVLVFDDEGWTSYRILMRDLSQAEADDAIDQVLRKGLAGWVFEHKQPAIVFDTSQDERWLHLPDDPEPAGSAIAIPFIERDRVRGLLTLAHPQPHHFNQVHLDLLSSIANQVTGVIERARLYEEIRHRAQEVAQQKEQTDAIVQSMADGLIVTDLGNRLVLANPAAEELLRFRLEDAIGQEIGAVIRDDPLCQIVRDTLNKQQVGYEVDVELADPYDGTQKIIRAHTAVVNDPSGQPIGIVTTLRDMTHEREVQRLKDELISTVSHELRTPMTSVLGFSELLLSRQLGEEKRQLYLQTIHKEAQRLSALINDFLDIQHMERGKQEYHFEEVDLGELAREMVAIYSGQSEAHTLTLDLPPELPPVQADPDRLRQVLGNLLSNAIKFSPDGGMVTVSVQVGDDTVRVAVSDNGIGVPAEALPRIFEKFFRVDSSDRREIKGTGLGLAICKEIVEAHEGGIWAESPSTSPSTSLRAGLRTGQLGTGTTVTFSLPLVAKKRILAIDDEKDIRRMFQRLLSENYKVLTAAHGQEGLALMEEELPDLVILDIAMPVMNGYQFLEKVKENQRMKDIPVVAISGVDTDIDRLKDLGTDEFLSKPFSNTVLLETMQRLLKRS